MSDFGERARPRARGSAPTLNPLPDVSDEGVAYHTRGRVCSPEILSAVAVSRCARALVIVAAACLLLTGCAPPGIRALRKGDRLIQSGKYDDAIAALTRATNLLGKDALQPQARAHNLLGLAYHFKGNAAGARACYEKALAWDRNNVVVEADYNLGCLELEQNNLPDARDALTTYTALRPQDMNGFMKLAAVNYRLAARTAASSAAARQLNFENARKAYEAAKRIKQTPEAWNNIAIIDLALMDLQRRPATSRAALSNVVTEFKSALACDTNYAPALLNLAVVYDPGGPYKFGDLQSAITAYRRYLALAPPPPRAAEVSLLVANLNTTERVVVQRPGQPPEHPETTGSIFTNKVTIIPKTNPPARETMPPPAPMPGPSPPPAASNHPSPAVLPASNSPPLIVIPPPSPPPVAVPPVPAPPPIVILPPSNHPTAVVTPAPGPEEPSRPGPGMAAAASNTPALPPRGGASPGISNTAAAAPAATNTTAVTNVALTSIPVPTPSLWSRLFGGTPKPADAGAGAAAGAAGTLARVTPLPGQQSVVHYVPPPVSAAPGNRAEAERLAQEGAASEKKSRLKEAMASYDAAVKADPAYYDACEALGMAAIKSEEYGVALEAFYHALALNSESANARYGYAWTLQKKGYYQDAANELEKMLARHPDETRAHLLLGNLYAQQLGQPDFARGHYLKVLQQDPRNDQAASLRAWLRNNPEP